MKELKANNIYILKGNTASSYWQVMKVLVIEVTEHTIYLQNLDAEIKPKFRKELDDFYYEWKVLEDLGANTTESISIWQGLKEAEEIHAGKREGKTFDDFLNEL